MLRFTDMETILRDQPGMPLPAPNRFFGPLAIRPMPRSIQTGAASAGPEHDCLRVHHACTDHVYLRGRFTPGVAAISGDRASRPILRP